MNILQWNGEQLHRIKDKKNKMKNKIWRGKEIKKINEHHSLFWRDCRSKVPHDSPTSNEPPLPPKISKKIDPTKWYK